MRPFPENTFDINQEESSPVYRTYKVDRVSKRILGYIDDFDAVMQFVEKTMETERYDYVIYSSDQGVELRKYFKKPLDYIKSDMPRSIRESLMVDARIEDVKDFVFSEINKDTLEVGFMVYTIYGNKQVTWEVRI